MAAADVFDGIGNVAAGDAVIGHHLGNGGVALGQQRQEDMLGADILIAQTVGFFIGAVNDALEARGNEDLIGALAINGRCARALPQDVIHPRTQRPRIHRQTLQHLWDDAIGLLQQRQQNMFSIDLRMAVTL